MANIDIIQQLLTEIQGASHDIKAEAQVLLAMEKGLPDADFMVAFDTLFKREYSKDLVDADSKEDAQKQSYLQLHLSRAGLYDQLPEGLFFQLPQRSSRYNTAVSMAALYRENKKKEQGIRRFFQPLENDLFLHRLKIEEEETALLQGLQAGILNEYFARFWGLSPAIPKAMVVPLILLLPYAYKIAGNLPLTKQCLSLLLNEKVEVTQKRSGACDAAAITPAPLGEAQLGLDMVCGNVFLEDTPLIEMMIGPLKKSRPADYLEGGNRFVLMDTFNRFFIPAGADTAVIINLPDEKQYFTLSREEGAELGYSSVLG